MGSFPFNLDEQGIAKRADIIRSSRDLSIMYLKFNQDGIPVGAVNIDS